MRTEEEALPLRVQQAADEYRAKRLKRDPIDFPVQERDFVLARPMEGMGQRIVYVKGVHERHLSVMLCHPYEELATNQDYQVSVEKSGLPYDLYVQTECRGVVWPSQVVKIVARMEDGVKPLGGIGGRPLTGLLDGRWNFKVAEGKAISLLSEDCLNVLLTEMWEAEDE